MSRDHVSTVWARDLKRTAWAWSCLCGARFAEDLPSLTAARDEAAAHCSGANRGGRAA
jgi:hypothetical protein